MGLAGQLGTEERMLIAHAVYVGVWDIRRETGVLWGGLSDDFVSAVFGDGVVVRGDAGELACVRRLAQIRWRRIGEVGQVVTRAAAVGARDGQRRFLFAAGLGRVCARCPDLVAEVPAEVRQLRVLMEGGLLVDRIQKDRYLLANVLVGCL